jgi:hypothetical protein
MKKQTKSQDALTNVRALMFDKDPATSEKRMTLLHKVLEKRKNLKSNIEVYRNREICAFVSEEVAFYGRARRKDQKCLKDIERILSVIAAIAIDPNVAAAATAALAE